MALNDQYCTPDELKAHANIYDAADDTTIGVALTAVSRLIEQHCHRQFNDAGSATARVYRPSSAACVDVDDFHTTSGLIVKTDSSTAATWPTTVTGYDVLPLNGVVDGQSGWPYQTLALYSGTFPIATRPSVQVTARWGWAAVPSQVKQACLIQTTRVFGRKFSHNGVIGTQDFVFRVPTRLDPDVRELLAPLVKTVRPR